MSKSNIYLGCDFKNRQWLEEPPVANGRCSLNDTLAHGADLAIEARSLVEIRPGKVQLSQIPCIVHVVEQRVHVVSCAKTCNDKNKCIHAQHCNSNFSPTCGAIHLIKCSSAQQCDLIILHAHTHTHFSTNGQWQYALCRGQRHSTFDVYYLHRACVFFFLIFLS